jgi:hypothetical protein
MEFNWDKFKEHVDSYPNGNLDSAIIIKDMIYGLGLSISNDFKYANGYRTFIKKYLIPFLSEENKRITLKHNNDDFRNNNEFNDSTNTDRISSN